MNTYFECKTNKPALSYKCGEAAEFTICLVDNECDIVKYLFKADDGCSGGGIIKAKDGKFKISLTCSVPGFVYLRGEACDKNGEPLSDTDIFEGGAGFDIDLIKKHASPPDDFNEFWKEQLCELDKVKPEVIEKKQIYPSNTDGFDVFDMKIACSGPMPVSGILTVPKGKDIKDLRVRVGYKGYGVVSAPVDTIPNEAVFFINAHGIENLMPESYYTELASGKLKDYGFADEDRESPHGAYFRYMIHRALQAVRFAKTLSDNVYVWGGSQGAFQAISATMLSDIKYTDVFVPWMCDVHAFLKGDRLKGNPPAHKAMRYYDLCNMATLRSDNELKVDIRAGLGDTLCYPAGVLCMYRTLSCQKSLTFVQNKSHMYEAPNGEEYKL